MVIRQLHGVDSTWEKSVPVVETFQGATVWDGDVEVFKVNHPKTETAYAWSDAASLRGWFLCSDFWRARPLRLSGSQPFTQLLAEGAVFSGIGRNLFRGDGNFTAVLGVPPATDPRNAVKVSIVAAAKKGKK